MGFVKWLGPTVVVNFGPTVDQVVRLVRLVILLVRSR